ncbi:hypothetical protein FBEOM_7079 [Fusarium beomiforme]|uniref:Zn(2)-C6 fungal-type domain-containing protein n=1 Tax=Fusarium beomiforme TaxID=44412 RepID=A0A9P5AJH0_9HYPO|nr:hypothetical protein FBEOM_7079 [Fusarium beomiforme]
MGASGPHPSQRRFSCDVCRKSKARCQRINPSDEKCAKCTMLGVRCEIGQQRVPGRPRRKAASKSPTAPTTTQHRPINASNPSVSSSPLQQVSAFADDWSPFDWTGLLSPNDSPPPQITASSVQDPNMPSWNMGFSDIFDLSKSSWLTGSNMELINIPSHTEIDFNTSITSLYAADTPRFPTSPFLANGTFPLSNCLTTHHPRNTEPQDYMSDLSTINLGLHVRLEAMKKNKTSLDFDLMIYQHGPLFIDNITLAEFVIKVAQDFLFILTRLYNSRYCPELLCDSQPNAMIFPCHLSSELRKEARNLFQFSLPKPTTTSEPLPTSIFLMITSIFIQLITIYELILDNIATRVERIAIDPIEPIPGLIVCGRPLERPCTQGMIFCEVSVSLIESIERVLGAGIKSDITEVGLLSLRQIEVLGKELDERHQVVPGHALMTPATLRKLLGKVADIFRSIRP